MSSSLSVKSRKDAGKDEGRQQVNEKGDYNKDDAVVRRHIMALPIHIILTHSFQINTHDAKKAESNAG